MNLHALSKIFPPAAFIIMLLTVTCETTGRPMPPGDDALASLHEAVKKNYRPEIKRLLDAKADPLAQDASGKNALDYAVEYGAGESPANATLTLCLRYTKPEITLTAAVKPVEAIALSAAGRGYATGFSDGSVKIYDIQTGKLLASPVFEAKYLKYGRYNHVLTLCFSPDDRMLAAGSEDNRLRIFDSLSGKTLFNVQAPVTEDYLNGVFTVAFSPDSRLVAAAGNRTVSVWETATGRLLYSVPAESEYAAGFTPDGQSLLTADEGIIRLRDASDGNIIKSLAFEEKNYDTVMSPVASPDGKSLFYADRESLRAIDIVSGRPGVRKELPGFSENEYSPYSLFFNPDGKLLAAALDSWEGTAGIFDVESGALFCEILHLEGDLLLFRAKDGTVETLPARGFAEIFRFTVGGKEYHPLHFADKYLRHSLVTTVRSLVTTHTRPGYGGP